MRADGRTDGRTDGQTDGRTARPEVSWGQRGVGQSGRARGELGQRGAAAEGGRHTTTDGTAHPRARFTPTARINNPHTTALAPTALHTALAQLTSKKLKADATQQHTAERGGCGGC